MGREILETADVSPGFRVLCLFMLIFILAGCGQDESKIRVAITSAPFVTLASLAGALLEDGHEVLISDLMIECRPMKAYRNVLESFQPEYVGITFTTPLYPEAEQLAEIAKSILPDTVTICGGVHATTLPEQVLASGHFDVAVIGEGELTIREICERI